MQMHLYASVCMPEKEQLFIEFRLQSYVGTLVWCPLKGNIEEEQS